MSSLDLKNETGKCEKIDILRNQHGVLVPNTVIFSHVSIDNPRTAKNTQWQVCGIKGVGDSYFCFEKKISEH